MARAAPIYTGHPGCDVYGIDLPGHGYSPESGKDSIAAYRDVLHTWADTLSLRPFLLVGHSMGGAIAQEFALRYRELLAGLVLVSSGARLRVSPLILQGVQEDFRSTAKLITDWALGQHVTSGSKRQYLRRLLEVDPGVLLGDFRACDAFDAMDRLGEISTPTLIICGTKDQLTPLKYSHYLHEHIRDAKLVLVEEAGHMVMLEQPAAVIDAVTGFAARFGGD